MYEIILESLALPQYTKIPCENKKCSYILIVLLEVLRWPFQTKPQNSYIAHVNTTFKLNFLQNMSPKHTI